MYKCEYAYFYARKTLELTDSNNWICNAQCYVPGVMTSNYLVKTDLVEEQDEIESEGNEQGQET